MKTTDTTTPPPRSLRVQILLAGVRGAVAGAVGAGIKWLIDLTTNHL
jgi:hypothetical protein